MLRPGSQNGESADERTRARLLRRYARWRRPEDLEELVLSYRPLARTLARRYATTAAVREDLEQAAFEGLIKAIHRFEPERGAAFASFAVPTILGELRRYLRDTAWPAHVPRSLQERVRQLRAAAADFSAGHGRHPTARELARDMACDGEVVVEALGVSSALSVVPLDGPVRDHDASTASVAEQIGVDDPGF
jgi:RNA polymerase sigma-B factor